MADTILVNQIEAPTSIIVSVPEGRPSSIPVGNIYLLADIDLGGQRVVKATTTGCTYADNGTDYNLALGFTVTSVTAGNEVAIRTSGELNGFSNLTVGQPIFLGTNGLLTQTAPTTGVYQQLGIAKSETSILVQIQQSIFLGN